MVTNSRPLNNNSALKDDTRIVKFSVVRVHEHKVVLGDNPAVREGVPVTLDWEVEASETCDVEFFENHLRRDCLPTQLSPDEREAIAREHGASSAAVLQAFREIQKIQLSRELSNAEKSGFWGRVLGNRSKRALVEKYHSERCNIANY